MPSNVDLRRDNRAVRAGLGQFRLPRQLIAQFIGVLSIGLYSFVMAYLIAMAIEKTIGFRVQSIDEEAGIDPIQHGQLAYHSEDPRWRN